MPAIIILAALAIAGFFAGRWLRAQRPAVRRRVLMGAIALPVLAVALIFLSGILRIDALGWMGGLSLMVGLPVAIPIVVGGGVGWMLGARGAPAPTPAMASPEDPTSAGASSWRSERSTSSKSPPAFKSPTARADLRRLLLIMLGVAAGFWVVIGFGFRLNGQVAPSGIDAGLIPASLVLAGVLALGIRALLRGGVRIQPWIPRPTFNESDERAELQRRWLAELNADPRRRVYAERIAAGDLFWTRNRVEYDLDPTATTCCLHLVPLERAMRTAGVRVRLDGAGRVNALATTNEAEVRSAISLPENVRYEEVAAYDRSLEDPPVARWRCEACNSTVWVVHPQVGAAGAVHFPNRS